MGAVDDSGRPTSQGDFPCPEALMEVALVWGWENIMRIEIRAPPKAVSVTSKTISTAQMGSSRELPTALPR